MEMMMEKRERIGPFRRVFLICVGFLTLALDRLEGKPTEPPPPKNRRIKIVD
jgi:hypothetical protein